MSTVSRKAHRINTALKWLSSESSRQTKTSVYLLCTMSHLPPSSPKPPQSKKEKKGEKKFSHQKSSYLSCDCSSYILSFPSLKSRMARLDFFIRLSMQILKYSFSLSCVSLWLSSYLPSISRRCWQASGKISRMYGGLFFSWSLGFWHSRTCGKEIHQ